MHDKFPWLKETVLLMGNRTLQAVERSIQAMITIDLSAAGSARENEKQVDCMYEAINEYCLNILTNELSRSEVNYIANSLKIAMELERICDYANQIAKIIQRKLSQQNTHALETLNLTVAQMEEQALVMLTDALKCYEVMDCDIAGRVLATDSAVDKKNKELFRDMICLVSVNPWCQELIMDCHTIIRYIERVGDRATNIAEFVYYIVHGVPLKKRSSYGRSMA